SFDVTAKRLEIAFPERLEDHPVSGLGAFEESRDIEVRVGREDRANAGTGGWNERHVAAVSRRGRRDWRRPHRRSRPGVRFCGPEDRLLLMPCALPEHAVEAKPDEQGYECEDDNNGQRLVLCVANSQHSVLIVNIPTPTNARRSHCAP